MCIVCIPPLPPPLLLVVVVVVGIANVGAEEVSRSGLVSERLVDKAGACAGVEEMVSRSHSSPVARVSESEVRALCRTDVRPRVECGTFSSCATGSVKVTRCAVLVRLARAPAVSRAAVRVGAAEGVL